MGQQDKNEAYWAGVEGRAQPNNDSADYRRGHAERHGPKSVRVGDRETPGGGGAGLLVLFAIAAALLFLAFVAAAAIAAFVSGAVLLVAARLWRSPPLSYREAYKASLIAVLAALITMAVIYAVFVGERFSIERDLVRGVTYGISTGATVFGLLMNGDTPWILHSSVKAWRESDDQFKLYLLTMSGIVLGPVVLVSGITLQFFAYNSFARFTGFLRAVITAPFVVFPGIVFAIVSSIVVTWGIRTYL
jgi:hypothetical protein